jgi:hypothetical protein
VNQNLEVTGFVLIDEQGVTVADLLMQVESL